VSALPPLWVISLTRATQRRVAVSQAFAELGLQIEFIEAVDGRSLTAEEVDQYSDRRALFEMGRGLSQGMFGCSLSHLRVYERMLEERVPVVAVFEDDVQPTADLEPVLRSIDLLPPDWQVVTLHSLFASSRPEPVGGDLIAGTHRVCRYRRSVFGTQGYLINLDGARRVLDVAYPVAFPPDELLFRRRPANLKRYGIEPTVLVHDSVESEIHSQPALVVSHSRMHRPLEWGIVTAGKAWRRVRTRYVA
jgi:glycosyl transferase family 25